MCEPSVSTWLFLWLFLGIINLNHGQVRIVCADNDTLTTAMIPIGTSGNWTLIEGGGNILWNDSTTSLVTGLARGTNVFVWSFEENGTLFSDTIRLLYQILLADAGIDQALCANEVSMQAISSPDGVGLWQLESGMGQIDEPTSPATRITQLGVGRNVFSWSISNGICTSMHDTVVILNYGFVQANAGIDQVICSERTTIQGNLPAFSNGYWSALQSGITFETPDSASTIVSQLRPGDNFLVWTLEIGNCASTKDTLVAKTASPLFAAFAGVDQRICENQASLHANRPTAGRGSWRVLEGAGLLINSQSHISQVENLSPGINSFEFTIENPPCLSSSDTITIEVLRIDIPLIASKDTIICSDEIVLRINNATSSGGRWVRTFGSGELANPQNPETQVRQLGFGLSVFRFLENQVGNCPSRFEDVLITRNLPPSVAQAENITICADQGNLQASLPTVGEGRWEITNGNIEVENLQYATSRFQLSGNEAQLSWVVENGNCPASQVAVSIRSNQSAPQAFAGYDDAVCQTSALLDGNSSNGLPGLWTLVAGLGAIENPGSNQTRVQNLGIGVNVFRWQIDPQNCPENFTDVSIVRFEPPETPFAGADTQICTSTWRMLAANPVRGKGTWALVSGTADILEPENPGTLVTGIGPGSHEFSFTVVHGPCRAETSSITIWNNNIANLATTGGNMRICSDSTRLSGNFPLNGDGVWTRLSGTGIILNPFLNQAIVRNLSIGENRFRWNISVPDCPTTFAEQIIFVAEPPTRALAGSDRNVCGNAVLLEGNEAISGASNWQLLAGAGQIAQPNQQQIWVFGLSPGQHVLEYNIENAPCPASRDTLVLTVQPNEVRSYGGEDQLLCENQAVLAAQWPPIGNGRWELIHGGGQIIEPANPVSRILNLPFGQTLMLWSVQQNSCISADLVSLHRPAFNFSLGTDTFLCAGTSLTLRSPENSIQHRWNTGDTSQNISVSRSGWYSLKAFAAENCQVSDSIYVLFGFCETLKTEPTLTFDMKLVVYPNPAEDKIHIHVDPLLSIDDVFIYDFMGKQMLQQNYSYHQQHVQITLQTFPSGIYTVKVGTQNKTLNGRFLKN